MKLKIDGDASGLISAVKNALSQIQKDVDKLKLSPAAAGAAAIGTAPPGRPSTPGYPSFGKMESLLQQILTQVTKQSAQAQQQAFNQSHLRGFSGPSGGTGLPIGHRGGGTPINNLPTNNSATGGPAMWAAIASSVLGAMGGAMNYIGQRPIDVARMQASAISMTTGRQLGEARSGEYTYESMYGGDRKKATEQAASSNKWQTGVDVVQVATGLALLAAAVPVGAVTGGLGGLAVGGGGAGLLKNALVDKGMLDGPKYAAYKAEREAQDFTTMLAAEHEKGAYRKDAIERLRATGGRDLSMQRGLGLKDAGYYNSGGYLQGQMDLGFTDEMVTGSSKGILGAGGSTAMARQSGMALQAERGLGLTNSNQLLGQLSGTQSIPETSKKTLVDIFSRGFDSSKYAEENRKYMQAVTEQVFKGGSTSDATASNIADLIKASVGNAAPTTRNIDAGKTAFSAYSASTSSTSGYAGGINITSAMQDPYLSKVKDPAEFNQLISLKPDEIDEKDPFLIESAEGMGLTGPQLAKRLIDRQKTNAKKLLGSHKHRMGAAGMAGLAGGATDYQSRKGYANMTNEEYGPSQYGANMSATEAVTAMDKKDTGNAGDTAVQASAKNAKISLETLSTSISKFASDAMEAANKLSGEAKAGRAKEAAGEEHSWPPDLAKVRKSIKQPSTQ